MVRPTRGNLSIGSAPPMANDDAPALPPLNPDTTVRRSRSGLVHQGMRFNPIASGPKPNIRANSSKSKPQRFEVQTGHSPMGSLHDNRAKTSNLLFSPLYLGIDNCEIEQTASTSRQPSGAPPVDFFALKTKRKSSLDKPGLGLYSEPLPEPAYHPDSTAGQSLIQEAALENLGWGTGLGGLDAMTPSNLLSYEYEMAAYNRLAPRLTDWLSNSPPEFPAIPSAESIPDVQPYLPASPRMTIPSAFSSFPGPVSSTAFIDPSLAVYPSPRNPKSEPSPKDPSAGRLLLSDVLVDNFLSPGPTAIGVNKSNTTSHEPTPIFTASPGSNSAVVGDDPPTVSGIGGDGESACGEHPLATQVWKMYAKTKASLSHQQKMENLTWRMMAMALKKRHLEASPKEAEVAKTSTPDGAVSNIEDQTKETAPAEQERGKVKEKDQPKDIKGEEQQRGRRPYKGQSRVIVEVIAAEEGCKTVEPEPFDAMDWRSVPHSRSRISKEWRAGGRSRSHSRSRPWPHAERGSGEAHETDLEEDANDPYRGRDPKLSSRRQSMTVDPNLPQSETVSSHGSQTILQLPNMTTRPHHTGMTLDRIDNRSADVLTVTNKSSAPKLTELEVTARKGSPDAGSEERPDEVLGVLEKPGDTDNDNKLSELIPTGVDQAAGNLADESHDEEAHGPSHNTVIGSSMTSTEVARVLAYRGCDDLTQQLDMDSCSEFAVSNGGFGDVFSGRLVNGTRVAIKASRVQAVHGHSGKQLKHAARELHTWSKCDHPNVLRLLGLVEFRGQIGMVSQWIDYGSIWLYLNRWPDANRRQLCYGICDGLAYLHSNGIVHGDLKGANVLVSDGGTPLLTDFGNSVLNNQSLKFTKTTEKTSFSPRWTAPEVLGGLVSSSYSADIFSLGMTLLETITGNVPYHKLTDPAVYVALLFKKQIPARPEEHLPTNNEHDNMLWSLFEQCWNFEPEHRPSAEQVRDKVLEIVNMAGPIGMPVPIIS